MYEEVTLEGFINEVKDVTYGPHSRQFCFFLGAGASKTSGIPSGIELVDEWDAELQKRYIFKDYEQWKQEKGITGKNKYSHYSDYYEKRFSSDRVDGFNYLESLMEKAVPSGGYACLAHLLTSTPHNVIVTTNFDRLTEDSVTLYTHQISSVIGHEAMAHYITRNINRPTIIKIHHDLLSDPRNKNTELQKLGEKWRESLAFIFSQYNPIFIGYAGNDLDVIDYLAENAAKFKSNDWKRPYWLLYGNEQPEEKVIDFLKNSNSFLIRHQGFDDVMAQLAVALGIKFPSEEEFMQDAKNQYKKLQAAIEQVQLASEGEGDAFTEDRTGEISINTFVPLSNQNSSINTDTEFISFERLPESNSLSETDMLLRFAISYNNRNYEQALFYIQKLLRKEPNNARYHNNYGVILHEMGRYEEALAEKQKAIALEPNNPTYHHSYSATLHELSRYEEALTQIQKSIELDPDNTNYHNSCGITLHAMGRYQEALAEEQKAINLEPNNANYHHTYGVTLYAMGQYQEALSEKQKAVNLEPNNANYRDSYSAILYEIGRYEEALAEKQRAIKLEPRNAKYHHSCSAILHKMGQDYEALTEETKAIELEPNNAKYYESYGATLHTIGRYHEALTKKQKAIELEPNNANYHNSYGITLHALGRYKNALTEIQKAIELEPNNATYHHTYGITLHAMGKHQEALTEEQKAIELEPNNASYHDKYSTTLHEMRQYEEALVEAYRSIELDPNNAKYNDSCAVTLHAMGRYQEALTKVQKSIELEPNNPMYYTHLSAIFENLGDVTAAAAASQMAAQLRQ